MGSGKKKILIVAGEVSGDLHGSRVARALTRLDPAVQIFAMGSQHLREEGAAIIADSSRLAVVGITEVMGRIGGLLKASRSLKKFIRNNHPSLLILIDFPDFNLSLAGVANKVGVPVLYYISPQVWAWRSGRVKKIARLVNRMAVILPFEVPIYQSAGLDVEFVGHPLLDVIGSEPAEKSSGQHPPQWEGDPLIALLPGSREKEIQFLLPEMIRAAEVLSRRKKGAKFLLPAAPTANVQEMRNLIGRAPVPISIVEGKTYAAIRAADMAIVASGTATLETAIFGKPMVIVYQVSPLSYWIGKAMVKVRCIGLVNIVAGKKIVPELIQDEVRGEKIAAAALKILDDEAYRKRMMDELAEVRRKLGTPGAAERVARIALEMMKGV